MAIKANGFSVNDVWYNILLPGGEDATRLAVRVIPRARRNKTSFKAESVRKKTNPNKGRQVERENSCERIVLSSVRRMRADRIAGVAPS